MAKEEVTKPVDATSIPKGWVEEQVGYAPYWKAVKEGDAFIGRVLMRDERNEEFVRYILECTKAPVVCARGPAEGAEEVIVNVGEEFTCSAYAALPLDRFYGLEVMVIAKGKRKLNPTNDNPQKRDLWEFRVLVSPEDKKKLALSREEAAKRLAAKREKQLKEAEDAIG
jgi:hypothetical protein